MRVNLETEYTMAGIVEYLAVGRVEDTRADSRLYERGTIAADKAFHKLHDVERQRIGRRKLPHDVAVLLRLLRVQPVLHFFALFFSFCHLDSQFFNVLNAMFPYPVNALRGLEA